MIADRPDTFDARDRFEVFTASRIGLEAVKDPVGVRSQGLWWMYVSCASPTEAASEVSVETLQASQDVYTTGKIYSATGLAVSRDQTRRELGWECCHFSRGFYSFGGYGRKIRCKNWFGKLSHDTRIGTNHEYRICPGGLGLAI